MTQATSAAAAAARTGSRIRWDPRTKLFALLSINILVVGNGGLAVEFGAAAVTAILLATATRGTGLWSYLAVFCASALCFLALPQLATGPGTAILVSAGFWIARFAVTIGLCGFVFLSTGVGELTAGLAALRMPRVVIIPFTVMLRFIPTAIEELRAIVDAMRLRGIAGNGMQVLAHPLATAEHLLVPLLASSTHISDDLSASALLRGLGTTRTPTSIVALGFRLPDAILLVAVAGLILLDLHTRGVL